ncbi:flavodoxin domain-containing protein [Roseovarius sp. M141]|uniref:flavodoxin domain-containing protein n=1 Tax=Roseovarius sp. M141 TaxID=2583806 RepID=UPI0020CB9FFF|nr:flavodoxin domain-containing protein [Roseovarius sp. M141]MCQ0092113.1 protoporphyrinogen oxidase [Roseovarius sp. M141]
MNILIIYATVEGQTFKIARFTAEHVKELGHDVVLVNADDPTKIAFEGIDAVILAAPVHQRRHPKTLEALIEASRSALEQCRTLLMSVSLSAAFPEGLEDAKAYVNEMKTRESFSPDTEMLVAGAIRTGEYDYFATQFVQHVVLRDRGYDFSTGEHEFTDWQAVASGVSGFLETV